MKYVIGLFISLVGFYLAIQHLDQDWKQYWDFVAFFVVVMGTFAVMLITFPAAPIKLLILRFSQKFFLPSISLKQHAQNCLNFITNKKGIKSSSIEAKLLNDGFELHVLGFSKEKIMDILSQRFEVYSSRINALSMWFKRGAKYPPAFGLAGTVLGLIHLMRGISTGVEAKETGIRMAIALVATFYGLLLSNLIMSPLGEWLQEELKKDELKAEMALNSVALMMEGATTIEAQESLNSYLSGSEKLKFDFAQMTEEQVA
jgi:chemotaxis protein MotA